MRELEDVGYIKLPTELRSHVTIKRYVVGSSPTDFMFSIFSGKGKKERPTLRACALET